MKVLGISCFWDELGLACKGFPKSIMMLGVGIGLAMVGPAMATKICGGSFVFDVSPVVSSIDGCIFLFLEIGFSMKSTNMPTSISCWTVRNPLVVNSTVNGGPTSVLILLPFFLYNDSLSKISSNLMYSQNKACQSTSLPLRAS